MNDRVFRYHRYIISFYDLAQIMSISADLWWICIFQNEMFLLRLDLLYLWWLLKVSGDMIIEGKSSDLSKLCKKLSLEKSLHLANEYGKSSRQFKFCIIVAYVKSWSISVSAMENHITFALLVLLSGLTFLFTLMLTIL